MIMNNFIKYVFLACDMKKNIVIGGPYVSDQAGLNRGPLIQNCFIVTLYILFAMIE